MKLFCHFILLSLVVAWAGPAPAADPPTKADVPSATAAPTADPGFIREMLACGPWRGLAATNTILGPDELPFEGHITMGRLWTAVSARDDGFVDLGVLGSASPGVAGAHVYVYSDSPQDLLLLLGSDDRAQLFLNGRRVHTSKKNGAWQPDQEKVAVHLEPGWNRLLARAENDASLFGISLRFTLRDGRPVRLRTSAAVPEALLENPQLKRPLAKEEVDELLELLRSRIDTVSRMAARAHQGWSEEGPALDRSYNQARSGASDYAEALEGVLETMVASANEAEETRRQKQAAEAREQLWASTARGPAQLTDRTQSFLAYAEKGSQLWAMVRFAASTALDAGNQAAEVDHALVEARALLAALRSEYLRPYRLREDTLQHRTAEATLRLVTRDGGPLADAEISVEQLDHHFLFGCNLFAFRSFPTDGENETYLERFRQLFNLAVVPTYWSLTEPREGQSDYARDALGGAGPDVMIDWCASRGLKVMGTPLASNAAQPRWLKDKSAEDAERLVEAHVRELAARYKGRVALWDSSGSGGWPTLTFGKLQLPASYLLPWAHAGDPAATLLISGPNPFYLRLAAHLQARESFDLGGVALTCNQASGAWPIEDLESRLARLENCGVPVHISQVMIPGPAREEALQAEAVEAFYRTAFANPAVRSITWWDLSDRFALGSAPGGLLRADLTAKPAYQALNRLIHTEWSTNTAGRLDEAGEFRFRGYFGRYRVRVSVASALAPVTSSWEFELSPGGPREIQLAYPPKAEE
jgi:hypothetical protein